jgi:hypothetical protein
MSKTKRQEPSKKRDLVAYAAIVHMKGGPMRDRRERKPLEQKREWRKQAW